MQDLPTLPNLKNLPLAINHVGYLTEDLERSVATWTALGATNFQVFEGPTTAFALGEIPLVKGFDAPGGLSSRVELTQPKADGLFRDRMAKRGPGLDHFGVVVPDFAQYFDALIDAGCVMIMDMRKATLGADHVIVEHHRGMEACFMNCEAIGFPNIEMFGP